MYFDAATGEVKKCLGQADGSKGKAPAINFNSEEDFSPDTDVKTVAHKYWNWLLYPLSLKQL